MIPNIKDANSVKIEIGSIVNIDDSPSRDEDGKVIEITDWDGDVDDEGKPFGIAPRVIVLWADLGKESFHTYWEYTWANYPDGPDEGVCEDLIVIQVKEK